MEQLEISLTNIGYVISHVNPIQTTSSSSFAVEVKLKSGFSVMGYFLKNPSDPALTKEEGEHEAFLNAIGILTSLNPSHYLWHTYQEYCVKELINE